MPVSDCDCEVDIETRDQQRVLVILLAINAAMFVAEFLCGLIAESTGLIADSLDMLADAMVYGVGLYAVGKAAGAKAGAALLSGIFQIVLALGVAAEIARRIISGSDPEPFYMVGVSLLALAANVACLALIARHRDGEVHMRASWVFSRNDVIANLGVIAGGVMVYALGSRWPDLIIGTLIVFIVFRGGITIIGDAHSEWRRIKNTRPA